MLSSGPGWLTEPKSEVQQQSPDSRPRSIGKHKPYHVLSVPGDTTDTFNSTLCIRSEFFISMKEAISAGRQLKEVTRKIQNMSKAVQKFREEVLTRINEYGVLRKRLQYVVERSAYSSSGVRSAPPSAVIEQLDRSYRMSIAKHSPTEPLQAIQPRDNQL